MKRSVSISANIRSALPHLDDKADLLDLLRQQPWSSFNGRGGGGCRGGSGSGGGGGIVNLGLGQSPFPPPPTAADLLRRHADAGRYAPSDGLPELRRAIADFHQMPGGADRVVVGPGCRSLLFALLMAFDGRVFVAAPAWSVCCPQCRLLASDVVPVRAGPEDGWKVRPAALRKAAAEAAAEGEKPRLLVLANPGNPSGQCYSADELSELAEVLAAEGFTVVSDETYALLRHDGGRHRSLAEFYPAGTVVLSGISKWAALAGWRIGYAAFPWQLADLQEAITSVLSHVAPCAPTPQQLATTDLLRSFAESPDAAHPALSTARQILRELGEFCVDRLADCGPGVRVLPPQAGFFMLIDLSGMAEDLECLGMRTGGQVCTQLLRDTGVLLLPGDAFMLAPGDLVLRLCFVDFDGEAAAAAAAECRSLGRRFVLEKCQPTADAVLRLRDWLRAAPARAEGERAAWREEILRVGRELAISALMGALDAVC